MCAKTYNVWKRITCYPYPLVGFSLHRIPWFIGVQTPHTLEQQPTAYSWKQKNHTRTRGLGITSRFQQSERTGCKHEETRRLLWCQCRVRLALEPHKSVSSCFLCSGMCVWPPPIPNGKGIYDHDRLCYMGRVSYDDWPNGSAVEEFSYNQDGSCCVKFSFSDWREVYQSNCVQRHFGHCPLMTPLIESELRGSRLISICK